MSNFISGLKTKIATKLFLKKMKLENAVRNEFEKKDNGDAQIIVMIGLILVAVFLLVIFRDSIKSVVEGAINSMQTKLNGLLG